jgi:hypothetical protein
VSFGSINAYVNRVYVYGDQTGVIMGLHVVAGCQCTNFMR